MFKGLNLIFFFLLQNLWIVLRREIETVFIREDNRAKNGNNMKKEFLFLLSFISLQNEYVFKQNQ